MANVDVTVEGLTELIGRDLGVSRWMTVEQPRVDLFADATEDHQWIHVDPARARTGPFGTTIVHGYLTLSLVPYHLDQLLRITDQTRGANYGLDRVRFTNPVPVGAEIRMTATLQAVKERSDGGRQFTFAFEMEIKGEDRPAVVGEAIYLTYAA